MKKILSTLIILVAAALSLNAIVAPKTPIKYTQPDGSVVTIVNHGDEFHSWVTMNGKVVVLDSDGYWRPAPNPSAVKKSSFQAIQMRRKAAELYASARQSSITKGAHPFLVVLVEFNDLAFTVENPAEAFSNLLNQQNYSANGGTGSAKDYYMNNSCNQFTPTFDVKGPVKISQGYAYYGQNSGSSHNLHAAEGFHEAVVSLDATVDFSQYDVDGDGTIDNIFFYFAGHNEAEHAGEDTIWPHASSFYNYQSETFDGKRLGRYACTSEYNGSQGSNMCGIGTFCHEFGHVLGLPDFYDTDYEENGTAYDMDYFDLMSSGGYLNDGRTPAALTTIERVMLGWKDGYSDFEKGSVEIGSVQDNIGYKVDTNNSGEFFVLEVRDQTKWDAYLPGGLLLYHVDQSGNVVASGTKAKTLWNYNMINCFSDHPCCYIVAPVYNTLKGMVYPGSENVKTIIPEAWSGKQLAYTFKNISYSSGKVTMTVDVDTTVRIEGKVINTDGEPLEGASIFVAPTAASVAKASLGKIHTNSISRREANYSAKTGADGTFTITLNDGETATSFDVTASMTGYVNKTNHVDITGYYNECNFVLRSVDAASEYYIYKYDADEGDFRAFGTGAGNIVSMNAAVGYAASELTAHAGMNIQELVFQINADKCDELYALIDFGNDRVLSRKIENPDFSKAIRVDVSDANLVIPVGKAVKFGYAVKNAAMNKTEDSGYPLVVDISYEDDGAFYYGNFNSSTVYWASFGKYALLYAIHLKGDDPITGEVTLAKMGYSCIADPKAGVYAAGEDFALEVLTPASKTAASVEWTVNGSTQSGSSIKLASGKNVIKAKITYADTSTEDLTFEINAN